MSHSKGFTASVLRDLQKLRSRVPYDVPVTIEYVDGQYWIWSNSAPVLRPILHGRFPVVNAWVDGLAFGVEYCITSPGPQL